MSKRVVNLVIGLFSVTVYSILKYMMHMYCWYHLVMMGNVIKPCKQVRTLFAHFSLIYFHRRTTALPLWLCQCSLLPLYGCCIDYHMHVFLFKGQLLGFVSGALISGSYIMCYIAWIVTCEQIF